MLNSKSRKMKPLSSYSQSHPTQLSLFQHATAEDGRFSNLIFLWDAIPKYYWGTSVKSQSKIPTSINRTFVFDRQTYKVRITPAIIRDKEGDSPHYPGTREEMIEAALRLLAERGAGVFLDDQASAIFTIRELKKELDRMGHNYGINEIKEGLMVCRMANIELYSGSGDELLISSILDEVGLANLNDWREQGAGTKCYVRFNSMVTRAIMQLRFRHINYELAMSLRLVIARQLFKRMSMVFTQASIVNKYEISLDTIIRDFGLTRYEHLRANLRDVLKSLDELVQKDVILKYEVKKIFSPTRKNKIENAIFTIWPTAKFSYEMRIGNNRQNVIREAHETGDMRKIKSPVNGQLLVG